MKWFVEDPTPILVAAVLAEAILIVVLVKTGRGAWLWGIAGVAVLALALMGLEWLVVTDRERVEDTLSGAARALEANDPPGVMKFIDPAVKMRDEVAAEMSRVKVERATYNRLDVTVNRHTSPATATADFMGYLNAKDRKGEMPYENFARHIIVRLREDGDRWVMTGFEMPEGMR